jgi:hypothetical protein
LWQVEQSSVLPVRLPPCSDSVLWQSLHLATQQRLASTLRRNDLDGFRRVLQRESEHLSEDITDYYSLVLHDALGYADEALMHARKLLTRFPGHGLFQFYEASLLYDLGKFDDSQSLAEALLSRYPGEARLYELIASRALKAGNLEAAMNVILRAKLAGLDEKPVNDLYATLLKARDGPSWPRRFEVKTQHYRVVTDLSESVARSVAQHLESAYLSYQTDLEWVKRDPKAARFDVLVFSGNAGYSSYCKDLYGSTMTNSAGLYAHVLRQLLIQNLPETEQMMKTVRHEGLHQYMGGILTEIPIWFNEGMAEYYESAEYKGGRWQTGVVRKDHLETLTSKSNWELKDFLSTPQPEFMKRADHAYAQSWAFVHFLRHSDRKNKQLFGKFFESFRETPSGAKAMETMLASMDLQALEKEFRGFLKTLN